jgi:Spy/CpxP family protein refolding chaperone
MDMVRYCCAVLAVAVLAWSAGSGRFAADEPRGASDKERLEALASKLGLNDQQKQELHKIHTDFDRQADPVEQQLFNQFHQEFQAMRQALTEEQRNRIPELLKTMRDKELQKIASELNLNDDQKQRLGKVCEEYGRKLHELATHKETGEGAYKQFCQLRHEFVAAIRPELTEEQRFKLPMVLREEFRYWHNPTVHREHLRALADKLGVSGEQRERLQKIYSEYDPRVEKLVTQLKQIHQEEHAALEKVLTPEQRTKFQELHKSRQ